MIAEHQLLVLSPSPCPTTAARRLYISLKKRMIVFDTTACEEAPCNKSDDARGSPFGTVYPRMLQIQSWAYANYRRSFSVNADKLNELHRDGNTEGYLKHFSFTVDSFLDPSKPQYINPPAELLSTIEEITEINNAYCEQAKEQLKERRKTDLSRRKLAKQRSAKECGSIYTCTTSTTSESYDELTTTAEDSEMIVKMEGVQEQSQNSLRVNLVGLTIEASEQEDDLNNSATSWKDVPRSTAAAIKKDRKKKSTRKMQQVPEYDFDDSLASNMTMDTIIKPPGSDDASPDSVAEKKKRKKKRKDKKKREKAITIDSTIVGHSPSALFMESADDILKRWNAKIEELENEVASVAPEEAPKKKKKKKKKAPRLRDASLAEMHQSAGRMLYDHDFEFSTIANPSPRSHMSRHMSMSNLSFSVNASSLSSGDEQKGRRASSAIRRRPYPYSTR